MHNDDQTPTEFIAALRSLRNATTIAGMTLTEVPAPRGIAPYSAALSLASEEMIGSTHLAHGRFVIFYDPQGQENWGGKFRIVMMMQARTEVSMAQDPVMKQVAWDWLHDALDQAGAGVQRMTGTVTVETSESFGSLRNHTSELAYVEVRASWTPSTNDLAPHLEAWERMASLCAGQEPHVRIVPLQQRQQEDKCPTPA